ncbi:MAG: isopentenyl phosphate kinase [Patescibacteria group bacterium]
MKKLIMIKLGGSVITEKSKPYTVRRTNLEFLAEQLSQIEQLKKNTNEQIIIGHGAGSFGHYAVHTHGLETAHAIEQVQRSVLRMHQEVRDVCGKQKLPLFTVQPSMLFTVSDGIVTQSQISQVFQVLRAGGIPCVYGDVLFDDLRYAQVFSTERIFSELVLAIQRSREYTVTQIIHVGTVSGVLDGLNNVISEINQDNWPEIEQHIFQTAGYDVTGGMRHKIEESLALTQLGITTYFVNKENLLAVVKNEGYEGTVFRGQS